MIPDVENFIDGIPHLVPHDVDGEVALCFAVIAFFLTCHIMCQGDIGISENISRGHSAIGNISIATAEYLSGEVSGIYVDECVVAYLCQIAATKDVTIYIR